MEPPPDCRWSRRRDVFIPKTSRPPPLHPFLLLVLRGGGGRGGRRTDTKARDVSRKRPISPPPPPFLREYGVHVAGARPACSPPPPLSPSLPLSLPLPHSLLPPQSLPVNRLLLCAGGGGGGCNPPATGQRCVGCGTERGAGCNRKAILRHFQGLLVSIRTSPIEWRSSLAVLRECSKFRNLSICPQQLSLYP